MPATKSRDVETMEDIVARESDRQAAKVIAFERMKTEIIDSSVDLEEAYLGLSLNRMRAFRDMGFDTREDITRELSRHRATLQARDEVGDPAKLEAARAALAEAVEVESNTRAEIGDLDTASASDEPLLATQIRKLQAKLHAVTKRREEAAALVTRMEDRRVWLRGRAPKELQEAAQREGSMTKRTHPIWGRLNEVEKELRIHEPVDLAWRRMEAATVEIRRARLEESGNQAAKQDIEQLSAFNESDSALIIYAKMHCPETLSGRDSKALNIEKFDAYVAKLREEKLPPLRDELKQLTADWQEVVAEIEAPLERWVETGEF